MPQIYLYLCIFLSLLACLLNILPHIVENNNKNSTVVVEKGKSTNHVTESTRRPHGARSSTSRVAAGNVEAACGGYSGGGCAKEANENILH